MIFTLKSRVMKLAQKQNSNREKKNEEEVES